MNLSTEGSVFDQIPLEVTRVTYCPRIAVLKWTLT
jgi:hypothetical protein